MNQIEMHPSDIWNHHLSWREPLYDPAGTFTLDKNIQKKITFAKWFYLLYLCIPSYKCETLNTFKHFDYRNI